MKALTCVIPVHNYIRCLPHLLTVLSQAFSDMALTYDIIIYNDSSHESVTREIDYFTDYPNCKVIHGDPEHAGTLKTPYYLGAQNALEHGHQAVFTCESDAIPSFDAISKMMHVFNHPQRMPIASVSPMYTWNGKFCYPTGSEWLHDGLACHEGRYEDAIAGTVASVGKKGVPFLFTLWNPNLLLEINQEHFRSFMHLDTDFGGYAHGQGFHHLRLLDVNVDHEGGGKKSRKKSEFHTQKVHGQLNVSHNHSSPDLTLITPTGNRRKAFSLCEQWISRQTFKGNIQWIVVDDGQLPTSCTLGQEYIRRHPSDDDPDHTLPCNLSAALDMVQSERVLFIEDDDWYSPDYLAQMDRWLDDYELVGEGQSMYYHIGYQVYHRMSNTRWASLFQTGIKGQDAIESLKLIINLNRSSVDMSMWRQFHGVKCVRPVQEPALAIGIKGMPGRKGMTTGWRESIKDKWTLDRDSQVLQRLIGQDGQSYAPYGRYYFDINHHKPAQEVKHYTPTNRVKVHQSPILQPDNKMRTNNLTLEVSTKELTRLALLDCKDCVQQQFVNELSVVCRASVKSILDPSIDKCPLRKWNHR